MLSVRSLVAILAVALFSADLAAAFAPIGSNAGRAVTSALNVMGPKQAAAMEKLKNPAKYEQTIQGLMAQKGLTRGQAEKRYGEFLADPDGASSTGTWSSNVCKMAVNSQSNCLLFIHVNLFDLSGFALAAAEMQRREKGECM